MTTTEGANGAEVVTKGGGRAFVVVWKQNKTGEEPLKPNKG